MAHALDIVGERWSLLIVRELLEDDQLRYSDLHARLDGCGTNILAARLKTLEQGGVVRRKQLDPPPPPGSTSSPNTAGVCARCSTSSRTGERAHSVRRRRPATSNRGGWPAHCESLSRPRARARIEFRIGDEVASVAGRSSLVRSTSPMRHRGLAPTSIADGRPRPRCRRRRRERGRRAVAARGTARAGRADSVLTG